MQPVGLGTSSLSLPSASQANQAKWQATPVAECSPQGIDYCLGVWPASPPAFVGTIQPGVAALDGGAFVWI